MTDGRKDGSMEGRADERTNGNGQNEGWAGRMEGRMGRGGRKEGNPYSFVLNRGPPFTLNFTPPPPHRWQKKMISVEEKNFSMYPFCPSSLFVCSIVKWIAVA
jgi:hypothetical protein